MNKVKNLLLIIDPQNDFVNPEGTLYVNGGEKSIKNLSEWIKENKVEIDEIVITQDTHLSFHIGHSMFWSSCPPAFSTIDPEEVLEGKYKSIDENEDSVAHLREYMKGIKELGKKHTIWPEHCILGSWGWCFPNDLVEALNIWSLCKKGKQYRILQKGLYPWGEAYSVFTYADGVDTLVGEQISTLLHNSEKIFVAGVAKDYCVAYSVEDLVKYGYSKKLVFLDDCMAAIDSSNSNLEIFEKAVKLGSTVLKK